MAKYRKKPVVIEAIQLNKDEESIRKVLQFMGQIVDLKTTIDQEKFSNYCHYVNKRGLTIHTLEGDEVATIGDYIIRGIAGEFYPCKPDIFEKTYEKVGD